MSTRRSANVDATLTVDAAWLARLELGDRIDLKDARSAARRLKVVEQHADDPRRGCAAQLAGNASAAELERQGRALVTGIVLDRKAQ